MLSAGEIIKEKKKPLNETEILELVEGKAKVVLYSDLHKYGSIAQLLAPHGAVFLLYQQEPQYGHWTAVFRQGKDAIEFFDPYSGMPDCELEWTSPEMREQLNMNYPYLTELLYKAPHNLDIIYNEHKFQKDGKNISTCGRWCGIRVALKDLPLTEFVQLFDKKSPFNDDIVTIMTQLELNEN